MALMPTPRPEVLVVWSRLLTPSVNIAGTRSSRVSAGSCALRALLDNVNQALVTIDRNGDILVL